MPLLYFKKDGTIERYEYGYTSADITHDAIKFVPDGQSLIPFLNHNIALEDGIIFETFFGKIFQNHKMYSAVFFDFLGGFKLENYLDSWENTVDGMIDDTSEIHHLEIFRSGAELMDDGTADEYNGFHGYGQITNADGTEYKGNLSLSLSPVNELRKYELKLNTKFQIFKYDMKNLKNGPKIFATYDKHYTVYEVIAAILFEISFHGTDTDKKELMTDLIKQSDEIKEKIENNDFSDMKTIEFEDGEIKFKDIEPEDIEDIKKKDSSGNWYDDLLNDNNIDGDNGG